MKKLRQIGIILYQLYFEMLQAILKFTMVNADTRTKEHSEQSDRMRHLFVKSVLLGVLLFTGSCKNKPEIIKEQWIEKPFPEWPEFAMTNKVQFTDTTYTDIANSFLIDTGADTFAVTCKHIFLVFINSGLNTIDLGNNFVNWEMHPKSQNDKNVVINSLTNKNSNEEIGGFNTLKDRDWIIFSIKKKNKNIYPLKIRTTPLNPGEIIYAVGWAYRQTTPKPSLIKMQMFKNMGNYYYVTTLTETHDPAGRSGSPVIDKNGYLVGLVSGAEGKLGVLGSVTFLLKLFDKYGIEYEKKGP